MSEGMLACCAPFMIQRHISNLNNRTKRWLSTIPNMIYELSSDPWQITSDLTCTGKPSYLLLHSVMLAHSLIMWLNLRA